MDGDVARPGRWRRGSPTGRAPCSRATSSTAVVTVAASRPWAAGQGDDVGAVGRAEQLLEALGGQRRRLGQEREDPAAVVVDDDDAQVGAPARRSAVSAPASWTNAMSPISDDRRPAAEGHARAPSTPRRRCRWRPGWRGPGPDARRTTRGRGPASTTPRRARRRAGRWRATVRATAGSLSGAVGPEHGRRWPPRRSRRRGVHSAAPRRAVGAAPAYSRPGRQRPPVRGGRRRRGRGRSTPGPPTCTTRRARRGDPLRQHLRRRRPPDAHDDVGTQLGGEALVAQHGVEGGDGPGRAGAAPTSGRRAPATRWRRRAARRRRRRRRCARRRGSRPAGSASSSTHVGRHA